MEKRMRNFEEAGAVLGCSPHTLRAWRRRGMVPHFKVGRRILFALPDLRAFLSARRVDARSGEAAQAADPQMLRTGGGKTHG